MQRKLDSNIFEETNKPNDSQNSEQRDLQIDGQVRGKDDPDWPIEATSFGIKVTDTPEQQTEAVKPGNPKETDRKMDKRVVYKKKQISIEIKVEAKKEEGTGKGIDEFGSEFEQYEAFAEEKVHWIWFRTEEKGEYDARGECV